VGLVVAIVVSTAIFAVAYYVPPAAGPPPNYPTVKGNLTLANNSSYAIPASFLGVNLRADFPIGAQGTAIAATAARLVRWPGGALSDRFDPLALNASGLIYAQGALPYPAPMPAVAFVQWCLAAGCRAIITVPGEVDSPSYAAQEVAYFEEVLHFRPAYWEVGNEPSLWRHWGYPWSDWLVGQNSTPSPVQYAPEVAAYIQAIRAVDPSAPILGLSGSGTIDPEELTWIAATVAVNGPNLSAIALHVYPAGAYSPGESAAELFASLDGPDSLPARVAAATSIIRLTCSTCSIAIIADEVGVTTSSTGAPVSFPWVPYEAAEIIQGIQPNLSGLIFWTSQGLYPGSWLSGSGSDQLMYYLFQSIPNPFPTRAVPLSVVSIATGVSGILLGPDPSHPSLVLLVNANVTYSVKVDLSAIVPTTLGGSVLSWSNTTSSPVSQAWRVSSSASTVLLPDSILIWESAGSA